MKKFSSILLLFLLSVVFTACQRTQYTDQNGNPVDLDHHPGKWLVINYWAPWCEPCKKELPEMNHFYLTHQNHVLVYGVDYDHPSVAQLQALGKKLGLDYPLLAKDPAKKLKIGDVQGLPVTYVYNPEGKLVKTLVGPQKSSNLEAIINSGN
ncbi:MAG: thioredoxin [Gammaproteobacteria bacterium]|jgi:thiol-disulfide isomerase/thioredoxin|nr:thioredoxin [Gammaproteobacteria bacterium]